MGKRGALPSDCLSTTHGQRQTFLLPTNSDACCRTWRNAHIPIGPRRACVGPAKDGHGVARRVCGVRERSAAGGLIVKQTTKARLSASDAERVPGLVQGWLRINHTGAPLLRCFSALPRRCRMAKAGQKKNSRKKVYSPPKVCPCRR